METFFAEYWEQKPLLITDGSGCLHDRLGFSADDIDFLIARTSMEYNKDLKVRLGSRSTTEPILLPNAH